MIPAELARAKVNLFLHVTGRRQDGFHTLDSLAIFPPVGDELRLEQGTGLSLTVDGPFGGWLSGDADNLVLRAAGNFAEAIGKSPDIAFTLTKTLPVASGIGGGSADAAAALRLLAAHWRRAVPPGLAVSLGADVPVCLESRPARMGGIGEILAPAPALPAFGMVLVNPGIAVSTPAIFAARTGAFSSPADLPARWNSAAAMAADLSLLSNDLEVPAIAIAPIIADVLDALRAAENCLLARMSGSGATCFGIFPTGADATQAAAGLGRPGWWVWGGKSSAD